MPIKPIKKRSYKGKDRPSKIKSSTKVKRNGTTVEKTKTVDRGAFFGKNKTKTKKVTKKDGSTKTTSKYRGTGIPGLKNVRTKKVTRTKKKI